VRDVWDEIGRFHRNRHWIEPIENHDSFVHSTLRWSTPEPRLPKNAALRRALSIDNSLSERSVRLVAIGRKNYLFLGSDNGGTAAAVLYSIMPAPTRIRSFAARGCGLLPDAWLTAHPEARRCWTR
jgi:hypothetical protein